MGVGLERFIEKIEFGEHWLWTGSTDKKGYGLIRIRGKLQRAHRVSYANFVGPIPNGRDVHHTCEIHNCVHPDHLCALTEEQHRALHGPKPGYCKRGHKITYYRPDGRPDCRICSQAAQNSNRRIYGRR